MKDYKNVIATLKKEGAIEVKNCKITSVAFYTDEQDNTKAVLTLDKNVPGYIPDKENEGEWVKGEKNTINVFPSVIKALLREMPKYASLRGYLVDNEAIAKLSLIGSTVDVLACEVAGDEVYKNPFSDSESEGKLIGHDTIVHHVVKLVPGESMEDVVQSLKLEIYKSTLNFSKK